VTQKIGKFEILAELGQGAMGTVYRARDPILDRLVALKTIAPGLLSKGESVERFHREARAAARLSHPNIVTIYELGDFEGTTFIAMELLEGMDLAQAMLPYNRLTQPQKLQIVCDVCRGLDFAHKRGVIHRDVKPANIRLLLDGSVKIVDFGIARFENSSMTQTGLILGTPSYIAPEVLMGGRVDHRADVWAVGVMLYELLAGQLPYQGASIATLVYKIVHEPPPPIAAPPPGLAPALTAIVAKGMSKDPAQRYQDLAQMAADLEAVLGVRSSGEAPLPGDMRDKLYTRDVEEARRLLEVGQLEQALEAARRARALSPSRTEVVTLVQQIEDRLRDAPTLVGRAAPRPATAASQAARPLSTAVLTELRIRGASVFRELATFGEPPATSSACLSPVRDVLATSGADGAIRIWDLATRTRILTLRTDLHQRTGHDALATGLAFAPDGLLMASGHVDGGVHLWDLTKGEELPVKFRHEASVGAVAFAPDGETLASGGMDSTLKLWDVNAALAGESRREMIRQPSAVTALTYVGAWIVTGHANRVLRVLDAKTGRLRATLRGPEAQVSLLKPAPDGRRLAVASQDRTIRLYDLENQAQVCVMTGHRKPATSLTFFDDGNHLASVALDNAVQLWDLESRSTLAALWGPSEDAFSGVVLYGGGDHIAVALADGRIRVWGPAAS